MDKSLSGGAGSLVVGAGRRAGQAVEEIPAPILALAILADVPLVADRLGPYGVQEGAQA